MNYALATLRHDRQRYLPGVLAVTFSAVLISLQCGLLLGLFSITSIPIDHTRADIWVGSPQVLSVDLGRPIPGRLQSRLASHPGVEHVEPYMEAFASWAKPSGGSDLCIVIGANLDNGNLGCVAELTPEMRRDLTEPGSIIIDESEFDRLGITKIGDTAEINKNRIRVVGTVKGMKSLAGPYVFCSLNTARTLLRGIYQPDQSTYFLIRCARGVDKDALAAELRRIYPDDMSAFTSADFSLRSRLHWLLKTKAGIALGYAALLGLLVGMVVTSQTLYAATTASAREYAILLALGIPRRRIYGAVLSQSFWVGALGTLLAYPTVTLLAHGADSLGAKVLLRWWLLVGAAAVTMLMAMTAGTLALRSVRQIEPVNLLR